MEWKVTLHRLINWILALIICAVMVTSYLLDGPTDIDAAQAHAMSLKDAQKAEAAERRIAKAQRAAGVAL